MIHISHKSDNRIFTGIFGLFTILEVRMTICKHMGNRIVPIQYQKSDGNIFKSSENFSLFLLNYGSLVLELNGKDCFFNGKVVICTNNLDKIKLLHQSTADVEASI